MVVTSSRAKKNEAPEIREPRHIGCNAMRYGPGLGPRGTTTSEPRARTALGANRLSTFIEAFIIELESYHTSARLSTQNVTSVAGG